MLFFYPDVKGELLRERIYLSCSHRPRTSRISQARKKALLPTISPNLEQDLKSHGLLVNSCTEIQRRSPGPAPRRHPPDVVLYTPARSFLLRPGTD